MKLLKVLMVGALCALAGAAIAQVGVTVQNAVSGNEVWKAAQGPGGPEQFIGIAQVRNGAALKLFSGSGAQTYTMTEADSSLYWTSTAPTTWAITLPSPAFDGEIASIGTDTTLTTMVTVTAGSGQTLNGTYSAQTLTALTSVEFQYNAAGSKWYRLR